MTNSQEKYLVVSIHDVAPDFEQEINDALSLLDSLGSVRASLLVVPRYRGRSIEGDDNFVQFLKDLQAQGHEVVQHGLEHTSSVKPKGVWRRLRAGLFTRGEGEFLGPPAEEAARKLEEGRRIMRACRLEPSGFVAPAWLFDRAVLEALRSAQFRYTTTRWRIIDLKQGRRYAAPVVVLRGSTLKMSRLSRFYSEMLLRARARSRIVRVAIHPADVRLGALAWFRIILTELLGKRSALTYRQALDRLTPTA